MKRFHSLCVLVAWCLSPYQAIHPNIESTGNYGYGDLCEGYIESTGNYGYGDLCEGYLKPYEESGRHPSSFLSWYLLVLRKLTQTVSTKVKLASTGSLRHKDLNARVDTHTAEPSSQNR